jgi:hypothetical protein
MVPSEVLEAWKRVKFSDEHILIDENEHCHIADYFGDEWDSLIVSCRPSTSAVQSANKRPSVEAIP